MLEGQLKLEAVHFFD